MLPLIKNAKNGQKINFPKEMRIVSITNKLFETVGLLAIRLGLTELRLKNAKKKGFSTKSFINIYSLLL